MVVQQVKSLCGMPTPLMERLGSSTTLLSIHPLAVQLGGSGAWPRQIPVIHQGDQDGDLASWLQPELLELLQLQLL